MANALHKTLDVLARTRNATAVDLLIAAIHIPNDEIRVASLAALCKRHSTRGNIEAIRNLRNLTTEMRAVLERNATSLSQAMRQCLLHGDQELRANALEMVRWFEDFGQMPTLLNLIEDAQCPQRELTAHIIGELVNRLYDHLHFGKGQSGAAPSPSAASSTAPSHTFLRDAPRIRHQTLAFLESACQRYEAHRCPQVIQGLLVLADPESPIVKKLFRESSEVCRQAADTLLQKSTHPGVMSLIAQSMTQNYPHSAIIQAFEKREDPEFICHILRTWPKKLTQVQQKNFKDIKSITWLQPDRLNLEIIPPGLHKPLVAFVLITGLPHAHRLTVMEWMLKHGCPEGRTAATEVLVGLADDKVQEVILEGLESEQPEIQAWATSQLRSREIPHTFELLIERLDSPMPEVREAARAELVDFNMLRVLDMYEHLDGKTCLAVGRLVQKIDPQAIEKLKAEMRQPIRRKRIRAARGAQAMGMQLKVLDALLLMIADSDALVRRTVVEVLGTTPAAVALETLSEALNDPSPRVREAASRSLLQLRSLKPAAIPANETQPATDVAALAAVVTS